MVMNGQLALAVAAGHPQGPWSTAFGVIELVVIASWVLMFALLFGILGVTIVTRGRAQRRRAARPSPAPRDGELPARLTELRRGDPQFDEQLLLDASQTVLLLVFAAMTIGDDAALRQLATESFWSTYFGRYVRMSAQDRRRERKQQWRADDGPARRPRGSQSRIALDYQASVPELIEVRAGARYAGGTTPAGAAQEITVRVSFSQLAAMVRPDAAALTSMATATRLSSAAVSFAGALGSRINDSQGTAQGVSWISASGHYDLTFTRPAGARTDPAAALSSRTCPACGAAYRSELAIACEHCGAPRPIAWGQWRLSAAQPTE
jgi:hypothetical protein